MRDLAPFTIRIPPELKDKLQRTAEEKLGVSVNTEVWQRLEESFEKRYSLTDFSDGELIQELISRYGQDGIFILIDKQKQEAEGAIAEAVRALRGKLDEVDHAKKEDRKQRGKNR